DAQALHIHPLNYAIGLAAGCEAAGVRIFEHTPAMAIEADGAGHRVRTSGGAVTARHVVLAHSAYGRGLARALDAAVLPVATYVVASRPAPELLAMAITTDAAIADTRRAGDYYRLLPDGRLLWGGRITTQRSEPARLAAMLKRDIVAIYPQLEAIEIEHAWSGLMAYAVHKMPIIGPLGGGLWTASAFGGHGLNTTAMAGRLIAGAIAEGDDRYRLFERFGPKWAGGAAGRAATQVAYWSYQARDWLDERKARRSSQPAGAGA
ncbi:MAG: NAD(P)/FAD-dependent oxidoreductase, partial [Hyphomicrobiales bacterium]